MYYFGAVFEQARMCKKSLVTDTMHSAEEVFKYGVSVPQTSIQPTFDKWPQ